MSDVKLISAWIAVTDEMLADAPPMTAFLQYAFRPKAPLTIRERLTGWRHFTSSEGYTITMSVGWRKAIYPLIHPVDWAKARWRATRTDDVE